MEIKDSEGVTPMLRSDDLLGNDGFSVITIYRSLLFSFSCNIYWKEHCEQRDQFGDGMRIVEFCKMRIKVKYFLSLRICT